MKSNLFKSAVFLFFSTLPAIAFAQFAVPSNGATAWVGIRGGASFASEAFSTIPDNTTTSMTIGGLGGLTLEYWFDNSIAVSAGFLYDQKGVGEQYASSAQNRQPVPGGKIYSGNDNFTMSYLEIPILLKYTLGWGEVRPYLCAGPSIGELLQSSETVSGSIAPLANLKSYLQSTDLSIYAGLGLMDEVSRGTILVFEAGYAVGLSNIYKSSSTRMATDGTNFPDPIDPTGAKSGDFRIMIGAMWKL